MTIINHRRALDKCFDLLDNSEQWEGLLQGIQGVLKRNPYRGGSEDHLMWQEQAGINFPILYLSSLYLYLYGQEKGIKTYLFATRDCCHFQKIFAKLFPQIKSHYFHCSRNMFETAISQKGGNPHFKSYVKSLINNDPKVDLTRSSDLSQTMFIDVHGTGRRALAYFDKTFDQVPHIFLLSATSQSYSQLPGLSHKYARRGQLINLAFDTRGGAIESLNYDCVGTLQTYNQSGAVRDPLEYTLKQIEPYHRCMSYIIEHLVEIDQKAITPTSDPKHLLRTIQEFFKIIRNDNPIISERLHHVSKHKKKK